MKITGSDNKGSHTGGASSTDKQEQYLAILVDAGATQKVHPELFEALIGNASCADELVLGFAALIEAGATLDSHPELFKALIKKTEYADKLGLGFAVLIKAGATLETHPELFKAVIENARHADKLGPGFAALEKAGATLKAYPELFKAAIENADDVDKLESCSETIIEAGARLESCFAALIEAGARLDTYPELFKAIIENARYANRFRLNFGALIEAGATLKTYPDLFKAVIENPRSRSIRRGFAALRKAGATLKTYPELFKAIIENAGDADDADKLESCFAALIKAGATLKTNPELFKAIIENASNAGRLSRGFAELFDAGATLKTYPEIFKAIIENARYAEGLGAGIAALIKAGATLDSHPELFKALIKKTEYADKLGLGFAVLIKAGATSGTHSELFKAIIENARYAEGLGAGIAALIKAGATLKTYPELFIAIIENASNAGRLRRGIAALFDAGATLKTNPELFKAIIENASSADRVGAGITGLIEVGATLETNLELFKAVIENPRDADKLEYGFATLFSALKRFGMTIQACPNIYNKYLFENAEYVLHALNTLEKANYVPQAHAFVHQTILERLTSPQYEMHITLRVLAKVCSYTLQTPLLSVDVDGYTQQRKDIKTIIEDASTMNLALGPLNKSGSTLKIEALLQTIVETDSQNIQMRFEEPDTFMLSLPEQADVNLSLLLMNANLSHLTLDEALIQKIGAMLSKLTEKFGTIGMEENIIVKMLPEAEQHAIAVYTIFPYININKLLRGEELCRVKEYVLISPVDGTESLLANFLLGCLINDAANKLLGLSWQMEEKQLLQKIIIRHDADIQEFISDEKRYQKLLRVSRHIGLINDNEHQKLRDCFPHLALLYPKYLTLDRGEKLNKEVLQRRFANSSKLSSITSFSVKKNGSRYFRKEGTTRTKMKGDYSNRPVINGDEGEVFFSHGQRFFYTRGPDGGLFAECVCSPTLEQGDQYWSDSALYYAYKEYLPKPYKQSDHHIICAGKRINRPNHGLAHTYRKIKILKHVINYFAHHALDENFKSFCQSISDELREWLRVAAAFSVTGRDSEISASDNLKLYLSFKLASAEHFQEFIQHMPAQIPDDAKQKCMQERMYEVLHNMGNPRYESQGDEPGVNNHEDPEERMLRNYLHRILSLAHDLDLPRCYDAEEFETAMQPCLDLSEKSPQQKNAFDEMVRYNIDLIKAHGNSLSCDIQADGSFKSVFLGYKDIFAETSTFMKRLDEVSDTVAGRTVLDNYQFALNTTVSVVA